MPLLRGGKTDCAIQLHRVDVFLVDIELDATTPTIASVLARRAKQGPT